MFTGIITDLGKLYKKGATTLTFNASNAFCKKLDKGTSIAINGTCLTVFAKFQDTFSVEVMPETLNKTTLDRLQINDLVNLELPLTPSSFLSGHLVQGHVDAVTTLLNITKQGNSHLLKFSIPSDLAKYIVEKGSIAVNGISLTIIEVKKAYFIVGIIPFTEVKKAYFIVGIIPFTWDNTMLHTLKPGDKVNIEVDILSKYMERLLK